MHIRAVTTLISYIVTLKQGVTVNEIIEISTNGVSVYGNASGSSLAPGIALVKFTDSKYVKILKLDKRILSIEEDKEISTTLPISTTRSVNTFPWGIDRCDGTLDGKINRSTNTGLGISIYVIDTGTFAGHNEFKDTNGKSRVQKGMDFTVSPPGRGDSDCHGHGTHTASTAAGQNYGYATKATIVPVKVLTCRGSGSVSSVIMGIEWASKQPGPKVLSMSIGGGRSIGIDKATALAVGRNAVVVVAAGNDNSDACDGSPAAEPSAITVAATSIDNKRAVYSNYGKCVDMFAPGTDILGAGISSPTATRVMSGTSMACPHVTGVAATILQETPLATPAAIQSKLLLWAEKNAITDPKPETPNVFLRNKGPLTTSQPSLRPSTQSPTLSTCTDKTQTECTTFKDQCTWFGNFWKCQAKTFCGFKYRSVCKQHANYCVWDTQRRCISKK